LMANGLIPDPYYRDNELKVQWVERENWEYRKEFFIPKTITGKNHIELVCEGLDTYAKVFINSNKVAETDNMFRGCRFEVKPFLKQGKNEIVVFIDSPVNREKALEDKLPYKLPGNCPFTRKAHYHFGWDWGPRLTTSGIWRPIYIEAWDAVRVEELEIGQEFLDKNAVRLNLKLEILSDKEQQAEIRAVALGKKKEFAKNWSVSLKKGLNNQQNSLEIINPELWWPAGMGEQNLYTVKVQVLQKGKELDSASKRIGLRTLSLEQNEDQWGKSFQFVVNGIPFFAKGGNWIPADVFLNRVTPQKYQSLLKDCVEAKMNMLRVWGGGMYEYDEFYDICDELGLCVWQEFVFACASYPVFDPEFLANVKAEAEDNVRRLRHHASLAFWCGNNELEMIGLVSDDPERPHLMRWEPYRRLFDAILPEVVGRLDAEHDYWPSSSHTPGANRVNANDPTCGDAHLWGVWFERKPFEWYRTCEHRFNSEFGFQSFPEPLTVYGYTEEEDRNVTTVVMEHHQRSSIGNNAIIQYMLDWFRLPTRFDMMLWLSQVQQGMAMKYAVEHWRRSMPRGMGTLYWQVNDNWPVASWSSIDYHGRWKALHYMAKRFFAPILISGVEDLEAGTVEVHLTNDQRTAASGEAVWTLVNTDGKTLDSGSDSVAIDAQTSSRIATLDLSAYLATPGPRHILLNLEYLVDGKCVSSNLVHFARPKHLTLREPEISLRIEPQDAKRATVTLAVAKPALWAWLALDGVAIRASENYVHLMPGRTISIEVTSSEPLTDAQWQALQVYSLADTYGSACRCTGA